MTSRSSSVREFIDAIGSSDEASISRLLEAEPRLARAAADRGATRADPSANFLAALGCYVYEGDTPLHIAAAAYRADLVRRLAMLGANVSAQNRRGATPLHHAASGNPNALNWNPPAQAKTIAALIALGADPDAPDKNGTTPLHRAIRTRCSVAVGELLNAGADMARPTRNGSSPLTLAKLATGRGGSGSPAAKAEQVEIIRLLGRRALPA